MTALERLLLKIGLAILVVAAAFIYGYGYGKASTQARWDDDIARTQAAHNVELAQAWQAHNQREKELAYELAQAEKIYRTELLAAADANSGLRQQTAELKRRLPASSPTACPTAAVATVELFEQCAGRYTDLAGQADGLAQDLRSAYRAAGQVEALE